MSDDKQKTYHPQTAKFLAVVAECMPTLPGNVMQSWIGSPRLVQNVLAHAFLPKDGKDVCTERSTALTTDTDDEAEGHRYDFNTDYVEVPLDHPSIVDSNLAILAEANCELRLAVEYEDRGDEREMFLHPWLSLNPKDDDRAWHINLRAKESWRGHKKLGFKFSQDMLFGLLERRWPDPLEACWLLEIEYVDEAIAYIEEHYTFRLSVEENIDGWRFNMNWLMEDGTSYFNTAFDLTRMELERRLREGRAEE